jgi:cleavage and polyadenylation specificity factor subunit 4
MGTMDSLIAPINNIKFDIEVALEQQLGAQPLPFPGMDSKFSLYKPSIG